MDLFVGGHAQGKLQLVKESYGEDITIINEFHIKIRDELQKFVETAGQAGSESCKTAEGNDVNCTGKEKYESRISEELSENELADMIFEKLTAGIIYEKTVIISDEIGCGIVPMDRFDRLWRDITGKILVKTAKISENVFRVTCGIANKIK